MSPEQENKLNPEQENKLNEVYEFIQTLKSSATIPLEVDSAFRDRLGGELSVSTKGADTEDISIDEGGVAVKTVLNDPVGFLQTTVRGTTYYIPYYSA